MDLLVAHTKVSILLLSTPSLQTTLHELASNIHASQEFDLLVFIKKKGTVFWV